MSANWDRRRKCISLQCPAGRIESSGHGLRPSPWSTVAARSCATGRWV